MVNRMGDQNVEDYIYENARKETGISVYRIDAKNMTSIIRDVISNRI